MASLSEETGAAGGNEVRGEGEGNEVDTGVFCC
jgi:hypothetical protein